MKIEFGEKETDFAQKKQAIRDQIDSIIMAPEFGGEVDLAGVRATAGKTEQEWPDGYIHRAALDMGLTVKEREGEL